MRPLVWLGCLFATVVHAAPLQVRVATYNASLNRSTDGQLATDLSTGANTQARRVAEILQHVRPDIVLINEFDYDTANPSLARDRFHNNYLAVSQNGQAPLNYPYRYAAPSNTGVASGFDFDNNGFANTTIPAAGASTSIKDNYGDDCFGFGWFPGQYSFVVYSAYPIDTSATRTFQLFKWQSMPGAAIPAGWYSAAELGVFRLSSKNHVDLRIEVKPGQVLDLLASHPTPPSFDGAEDRNGRRNHDEIRFWADYISNAPYIQDDTGGTGGLNNGLHDPRFIILGDLNADPIDGDSYQSAINQLRNHPLVNASTNPSSLGGPQQSALQGGRNTTHQGDPAFDTADFNDSSVGNLRVDHVLPSKSGFTVTGSGVFWPLNSDPTFSLVSASDHRLVWMDLTLTPVLSQCVRDLAITREGGDVVITWGTQAGITYLLEYSSDLVTWSGTPAIPIVLNAATNTATATDSAAPDRKFYRVRSTLEQ
jgi:endonuclease/exonuclease/phosphatase family metal-dependent hydrolase